MIALRGADGEVIELALDRWRAELSGDELDLLLDLPEPLLDVGCGPGRVAAGVAGRGKVALGIDPAPSAVAEARRRGAPTLQRSVFDPLPGTGRWGSILLFDGNIGIGGDPGRLIGRCAALLRSGGVLLAEVGPPGSATRSLPVRIDDGSTLGPWFPWAEVAADAWADLAHAAGLLEDGVVARAGRWFGRAVRP